MQFQAYMNILKVKHFVRSQVKECVENKKERKKEKNKNNYFMQKMRLNTTTAEWKALRIAE